MINNPQPPKIKVKHDPGGLMEEEDLFEAPPTQPVADTTGVATPDSCWCGAPAVCPHFEAR